MAFAVCAAPGIAQQAPASAIPRSTTSGVYTADQAARGRDTYVASCQGCHTAAETFHPLGDLFVVYNHNILRELIPGDPILSRPADRRWAFASNELLVKAQYTFRY